MITVDNVTVVVVSGCTATMERQGSEKGDTMIDRDDPWYSVSVRDEDNGPSTGTMLYDQRVCNGALTTWQRLKRTIPSGATMIVEVAR